MLKLEYLSGSDEQDNEFFIGSQAFFINHRYIKPSLKPVTIPHLTHSKKINHQAVKKLACYKIYVWLILISSRIIISPLFKQNYSCFSILLTTDLLLNC